MNAVWKIPRLLALSSCKESPNKSVSSPSVQESGNYGPFPYDILYQIFLLLSNDSRLGDEDSSLSLSSLLRVCRAWSPIAQEVALNYLEISQIIRYKPVSAVISLWRLLTDREDLRVKVRCVDIQHLRIKTGISVNKFNRREKLVDVCYCSLVDRILALLPNVRYLSMNDVTIFPPEGPFKGFHLVLPPTPQNFTGFKYLKNYSCSLSIFPPPNISSSVEILHCNFSMITDNSFITNTRVFKSTWKSCSSFHISIDRFGQYPITSNLLSLVLSGLEDTLNDLVLKFDYFRVPWQVPRLRNIRKLKVDARQSDFGFFEFLPYLSESVLLQELTIVSYPLIFTEGFGKTEIKLQYLDIESSNEFDLHPLLLVFSNLSDLKHCRLSCNSPRTVVHPDFWSFITVIGVCSPLVKVDLQYLYYRPVIFNVSPSLPTLRSLSLYNQFLPFSSLELSISDHPLNFLSYRFCLRPSDLVPESRGTQQIENRELIKQLECNQFPQLKGLEVARYFPIEESHEDLLEVCQRRGISLAVRNNQGEHSLKWEEWHRS